jgi:hypothetical protein
MILVSERECIMSIIFYFTAVEQLYVDLALGGPGSLLGGTGQISAY